LNANVPSFPILTSGPLTYPSNRPIAAIHENKSGGKLLVAGSIEMFLDDFYENEENAKIMEFMIKFFLTEEVQFEFTK
jgi:intraflagellar transport protein 52